MQEKLDNAFGKEKSFDYKKFKQVVEEKNSDIYLFLLIFIMENRPFKKQTIEMYVGCLKSGVSKSPTQQSKLIASPSLTSKFSPSQFLSNSPCMKQKKLKDKNGLNILEQFTSKKPADKRDNLIKLCSNNVEEKTVKSEVASSIGPTRKNMAFLKNLEKESVAKPKKNFDENDPIFNLQEGKRFESQGVAIINSNNQDVIREDDEPHETVQYEGYIHKITESNKLKKLWFKLYDKDLFCKFNIITIYRLQEQGRFSSQGNAPFIWNIY